MIHARLVLAVSFALAAGGCAPSDAADVDRVHAALDDEGYALFEVDPGTSDRAAVVVEMRSPPPGTYVLLHSARAPESTGWFSFDPSAYSPCRRYGRDAVPGIELDCLVPDGRGEVVDLVTIEPMTLLPSEKTKAGRRSPSVALLRHEVCSCAGCECTSSAARSRDAEFYALLRVEPPSGRNVWIPFAVEVRSLGSTTATGSRESPVVHHVD